jgi:hypothetical protein
MRHEEQARLDADDVQTLVLAAANSERQLSVAPRVETGHASVSAEDVPKHGFSIQALGMPHASEVRNANDAHTSTGANAAA